MIKVGLKEEAEKLGHKVLPLPPYSPELNTIKKLGLTLKNFYKKYLIFAKILKKEYVYTLKAINHIKNKGDTKASDLFFCRRGKGIRP